ncbi:hexokinase type 2 [Teleopsis dalmanni]|uniref:hexokinase type 2 n=1 Tax=Teleopsis dalmanni TaxID=139649 RepID=UPI0018CD6C4B|nr:hexokinase type 2 [Teleopsis dalmanni]
MQDPRLKEFMKEFTLSDSQLKEVYNRFGNEIRKGLNKDTHAKADTKCFITYVQDLPNGDERGKFLALDLGGTNFRVLLVTLKGHHDATIVSNTYPIPQEILVGTGEQLFDHIAKCLDDFVKAQQVGESYLPLGFTFSFPCVQLGLKKSMLVRWTKGFQCSNTENEDVGRLLKEAIARRGNTEIEVLALLNDTTGTLMSCAHRNANCRIGLIVGTGCNACYVENVDCVDLLEPELKRTKKKVIINVEWGAFGDSGLLEFVRTDYDRIVDKMSPNIGQQLYEKMISGMYLGELVRLALHKATKENLMFLRSANKNKILEVLNKEVGCFKTEMLSRIEADTFPDFTNTKNILKELFGSEKVNIEDCQKLRFMCECVAQRAANLVAVGLAGLVNRINEPNVVIGVDGSVYKHHPKFDAYMRVTMRKFVTPGIKFDIMLSEDGSGRGAALVAAVASRQK